VKERDALTLTRSTQAVEDKDRVAKGNRDSQIIIGYA
jgi:hypothetical protein